MAGRALTVAQLEQALRAKATCRSDRDAAISLKLDLATYRHRLAQAHNRGVTLPPIVFANRPVKKRRLLVTCAQNATPIHRPFFEALLRYCEHNKAQLIVVPVRYKNPTSVFDASEDRWDADLVPYLNNTRIKIGKHLVVLGDIKVQPTAENPTSGFETITGAASAILAHPKLELISIPTPQQKLPKIITTTGAVTRPNYTDSKAGKKGEFHHTYGATIVEVDGDVFHLRQCVAARDGSFIDLAHAYSASKVTAAPRAAALVLGDTHVRFTDPKVTAATFGMGGLVETLQPSVLAWHDVLDFHSRNHHHAGRPFVHLAKHKAGLGSVYDEIVEACDFIDEHTPQHGVSVLVPSNHPDALRRWMDTADWRTDPENAIFYLETALEMAKRARIGEGGAEVPDPFNLWAGRLLTSRTHVLKRDESFQVKGVELGMHGDIGPNGARGSIRAFGRVGTRAVIGHSHSPGIKDGIYQVGTSSRLALEYNRGPSSWLNTHCVVYANGKRSLINIIDGRWHT